MVDISTAVPDPDSVQYSPIGPGTSELFGDGFLTIGTDSPGTLSRVCIDEPGQQVAHPALSPAFGQRTLAGRGAGAHISKVMPASGRGRGRG
ncbi:hypothetical protein GCM10022294_08030 [Dietzia aurantiaca]